LRFGDEGLLGAVGFFVWEGDAHLALFKEDAAIAFGGDLFFHPREFLFEEVGELFERALSEEKEALGNADFSELSADGEEVPEAASVFVNVGGVGVVFLLLALDADEHGGGVWAAFDFALDDDFGAAPFFFVKADPDAFEGDVVGELALLPDFESVGEPSVEFLFGDGDGLPVFGSHFHHDGDAGGVEDSVIFGAALNIAEVLTFEAQIDSVAKGTHEGEGKD